MNFEKRVLTSFCLILIVYTVGSCRTGNLFPAEGLKAIAVLRGTFQNSTISGTVKFFQLTPFDVLNITVNITGLPKDLGAKHGLHVHQSGITDTSDNTAAICGSSGGHFNPLNKTHGDISAAVRHVGDYGNVIMDSNGNIQTTFTDNVSQLLGPFGVLGRTIVLHQLEDDLGLKNNTGSLTTGNAGARLACGVIGILA